MTPIEMGYQSASRRRICGDCKHVEERYTNESSPEERTYYRCGLGDFDTTKQAICNQHKRVGEK